MEGYSQSILYFQVGWVDDSNDVKKIKKEERQLKEIDTERKRRGKEKIWWKQIAAENKEGKEERPWKKL